MELEKHTVIIGGGITELNAAGEIQNYYQRRMRFSLLEADSSWRGKVVTSKVPAQEGGEFIPACW